MHTIVPTSAPEPRLRDFAEGPKQTVRPVLISSQRNGLCLQQTMEKFKPKVVLQHDGGCGERKQEGVCRREPGKGTAGRGLLRSCNPRSDGLEGAGSVEQVMPWGTLVNKAISWH